MPPRPLEPFTGREKLALAGILALAAFLRLREAAASPLWFDEIYSLWAARLSWDRLAVLMANDIHPPLHYLLSKLWRGLGGEGAVWMRSLSTLAGLGTIGAAVALARDAFGNRAGLLAGGLLAVHAVHVGVSAESRFYALMGLCVWLAAAAAHRWVTRGGRGAATLLVAALWGGLMTHYLTGLVWIFLFGWGALALRRERGRLLGWTGLFAAAGVLFLPQVPMFLSQLGRNTGSHWIGPPDLEDLATLARRLSFGAWYLVPAVAVLTALPFVRAGARPLAWLVAAVTAGPVLLTWGLTVAGAHLFTPRYMFFVVTGGCVLAAGGLATLRDRRIAVAGALVLAALALRIAWITPTWHEGTGLGRMRALLFEQVRPGEAIVCADTHTLGFLRHYGSPTPAWMALPSDDLPYYEGSLLLEREWLKPPAALDSVAARGDRWWFVRQRTGGVDTRGTLARVVAAGGVRVWVRDSLTVWRVDRAAAAPR